MIAVILAVIHSWILSCYGADFQKNGFSMIFVRWPDARFNTGTVAERPSTVARRNILRQRTSNPNVPDPCILKTAGDQFLCLFYKKHHLKCSFGIAPKTFPAVSLGAYQFRHSLGDCWLIAGLVEGQCGRNGTRQVSGLWSRVRLGRWYNKKRVVVGSHVSPLLEQGSV